MKARISAALLGATLAGAALPSYAVDWLLIVQSDDIKGYIKSTADVVRPGVHLAEFRTEYLKKIPQGIRSSTVAWEIDCSAKRTRIVKEIYYAKANQGGAVVTENEAPLEWINTAENAQAAFGANRFCAKK
jgi:hypothetical protein